MRLSVRFAALLAATLGPGPAACSGGAPEPGPSPSPAPPACTPDVGTVAWADGTREPKLLQVVARYLDADRTTWRDLLDTPFAPSVDGTGTDRTWINPLARSLGELRNQSVGETPTPATEIEELHRMLEDSTEKGWVLGYTGTSVVTVPFTLTCTGVSSPASITGTLTSWTSLDTGFLSCTDPTARKEPSDYPGIWSHCPTD